MIKIVPNPAYKSAPYEIAAVVTTKEGFRKESVGYPFRYNDVKLAEQHLVTGFPQAGWIPPFIEIETPTP